MFPTQDPKSQIPAPPVRPSEQFHGPASALLEFWELHSIRWSKGSWKPVFKCICYSSFHKSDRKRFYRRIKDGVRESSALRIWARGQGWLLVTWHLRHGHTGSVTPRPTPAHEVSAFTPAHLPAPRRRGAHSPTRSPPAPQPARLRLHPTR